MEANAGMIAGSHKRNELVLIRHDAEIGVSLSSCSLHNLLEFIFLLFWI